MQQIALSYACTQLYMVEFPVVHLFPDVIFTETLQMKLSNCLLQILHWISCLYLTKPNNQLADENSFCKWGLKYMLSLLGTTL